MKIFIFRCGFDAVKNITTKKTECNIYIYIKYIYIYIYREREREREREVIPK